jgi:hypothetical protein
MIKNVLGKIQRKEIRRRRKLTRFKNLQSSNKWNWKRKQKGKKSWRSREWKRIRREERRLS